MLRGTIACAGQLNRQVVEHFETCAGSVAALHHITAHFLHARHSVMTQEAVAKRVLCQREPRGSCSLPNP